MIDVRTAEASEQDAVLNTLMLAFSTDPCLRFMLDTPDRFFAGFRPFATGMGGASVEHGTAWLADGGAAAAMWLPPGVSSDRDAMLGVLMANLDPAKLPTVAEVGEAIGAYHPEEPHWYLAMIGVDPARQGRGYGSALLKEGLKRCDEDGVIAYLESSSPKNVPLYERYGFEVMGFVQPGEFPGLYPMIRRPR